MEKKPRNLLVAVDGSDQSFDTVRYVGRLFQPGRAKVTLFNVMNRIPESFLDLEADPTFRNRVIDIHAWEFHQKEKMQDSMERARRHLKQLGYTEDRLSVVMQDKQVGIARDIAKESQKGYDALVLGRRGKSQLKDLILGSVANKLVSHLSNVPVWVIDGCPDPNKLLVAMDGSEAAMRALHYVGTCLDDIQPEILLFSVGRGLTLPPPGYGYPSDPLEYLDRIQQEYAETKRNIQTFLDRGVRELEHKGVDVSRVNTKIVSGVPSRAGAIIEKAQNHGYGTIVMGRKGVTKIREYVMGRVSNKVLQLAKGTAVWVVH